MSKSSYIKDKRDLLGLNIVDFAHLLGLGENGERTVRGWENGEHKPSTSKLQEIEKIHTAAPFKRREKAREKFEFIDLFAGIGGIRIPFQQRKGRCVFSSEWDKFSQRTYARNFGELPHGDITKIPAAEVPDHDVLLAGFPCQAFSQAGLRQGFNDTRGTMFFEIQRILVAKRPKAFLLENVKQLRGHDGGRTLSTILEILRGTNEATLPESIELSEDARKALEMRLNYWVDVKVLRAADFGVPQNRERIFIVGFDRDQFPVGFDFEQKFSWPVPTHAPTRVGAILEEDLSDYELERLTISDKLWEGHQRRAREHREKGNGFGFSCFNAESPYTNTLSARYYKDGSEILIDQTHLGRNPRKLSPRECANLQGFPESFIVDGVSSNQAYRQFGNSVCVPVVDSVAEQMIRTLRYSVSK